jgi:hypothetical protein
VIRDVEGGGREWVRLVVALRKKTMMMGVVSLVFFGYPSLILFLVCMFCVCRLCSYKILVSLLTAIDEERVA